MLQVVQDLSCQLSNGIWTIILIVYLISYEKKRRWPHQSSRVSPSFFHDALDPQPWHVTFPKVGHKWVKNGALFHQSWEVEIVSQQFNI